MSQEEKKIILRMSPGIGRGEERRRRGGTHEDVPDIFTRTLK
jgi:hypothetical protein